MDVARVARVARMARVDRGLTLRAISRKSPATPTFGSAALRTSPTLRRTTLDAPRSSYGWTRGRRGGRVGGGDLLHAWGWTDRISLGHENFEIGREGGRTRGMAGWSQERCAGAAYMVVEVAAGGHGAQRALILRRSF